MQITGKIIEKLPLKSGMGQNGPWAIAQVVVEFMDGQYSTNICLQNSKRATEFDALAVGATGKFDFSVSSRKSPSGVWFTSCNCYKWDVGNTTPPPEPEDGRPDLPF